MIIALQVLLAILGLFVGLLLLLLLVIVITSLFLSKKKEYKTKSVFCEKLMDFTTGVLVKLCLVKLETEGMDLLPEKGRRFLYVYQRRLWWWNCYCFV